MAAETHVFAEYVAGEVKVERERRASQEKTAGAVITTSSTFIGLVVAGAALLLGSDFKITNWISQWLVVGALALFVVSAIFALSVIQLVTTRVGARETLRVGLANHWGGDPEELTKAVAWLNFDTVKSLREGCNVKSKWLSRALWLQLAGAAVLATAVGVVVLDVL